MTWKISIRGQVQGVGFRPFIWREALQRGLTGSVANGLQGVVVLMNAEESQAIDFQNYILENAPETARITGHAIEPIPELFFDNFTIETSANEGSPLLLLTPDVALCKTCRAEIHNPKNRRFGYAFTTCTICGPRYSILTGVPYDRALTTMEGFEMCATCVAEYSNPKEHRYFAQTNSCGECGIKLQFSDLRLRNLEGFVNVDQKTSRFRKYESDSGLRKLQGFVNVNQVISAWQAGAIIAIKGIGGYLLTCDATNSQAIALLRNRKNRPSKPFALMYPSLDLLQNDAVVSEYASQQLQCPSAPIVLLEVQKMPKSGLDLAGIAPGLHKIGAMLPNAPLFELLLQGFGKPIVATSGNLSNTPLIFDDETVLSELSGIADYILSHNRRIVMPQDDSVVALTLSGKPILLRRARGLAPTFIQSGLEVTATTVLALGAEMKSSFSLAHLGNLNISQYLGDLSDFETQQRFEWVLKHLLGLFKAQPEMLLGDLHPGYFTTALGQSLAKQWNIPFLQIQHHKAHFAAVLAENGLFDSDTPVLGIIWDGTGLGEDGQIWGGEFLVYDSNSKERFQRSGHLDYFPVLLGDKMAREPRLSALSTCRGIVGADHILRPKFTETEWNLYPKLALQPGQVMTSSVGRLFDAVASLLGLADKVSYEGETALLLEDLGRSFCQRNGYAFTEAYSIPLQVEGPSFVVKTGDLFQQIMLDLERGSSAEFIAAKFHFSMVLLLELISNTLKIKKIAFSGGVFQNTLLVDMIEQYFESDYALFFHRQLSPNDENISFGQWAYTVLNKP